MTRQAKASYIFDVSFILEKLLETDIDRQQVDHCLRAFLEYKLFKLAGFNVVWTLAPYARDNAYVRFLEWKVRDGDILDAFYIDFVKPELRPDECYLFLRGSTALIAYY